MNDFIYHINRQNQFFKCYDSKDETKKLDLIVSVSNILNTGATEKQIQVLKKLIPTHNEEIIDLYRLHNGLNLYRNTEQNKNRYSNDDISGICFYPINELKRHNKEWKDYLNQMFGSEEDYDFDFQKYGVTFGEIYSSLNSFVLFEGKVYYDNHDDFDDTPLGNSVNEFLSKIIENPAKFLEDRGGYTRYEDNESDKQWIPKEYFIVQN